MNVERSILVLAALWLGACIAGPTPHPALDAGAGPNLAGQADAGMDPSEEFNDGQTDAPSADVSVPSDDLGSDDASNDSSGTSDEGDSSSTDTVMDDAGGAHSGPIDAG